MLLLLLPLLPFIRSLGSRRSFVVAVVRVLAIFFHRPRGASSSASSLVLFKLLDAPFDVLQLGF
jgi:hypothetical protein